MINLKCPRCGEESIISSKWNRYINESDQECRLCGFTAPTYIFIHCHNDSLEPGNDDYEEAEYDPCFDENGHY